MGLPGGLVGDTQHVWLPTVSPAATVSDPSSLSLHDLGWKVTVLGKGGRFCSRWRLWRRH
eukprot:161236-Rhodomonas_salina.1